MLGISNRPTAKPEKFQYSKITAKRLRLIAGSKLLYPKFQFVSAAVNIISLRKVQDDFCRSVSSLPKRNAIFLN